MPLLVLALFGALLVAGCGGDDDGGDSGDTSTETSSEALTPEEYSTTVTDALTTFGTEFQALGEAVRNPDSPEDYVAGVQDIQDRVGDIITELEGISPPPEAEEINADLIAAFEDLEAAFTPIIETAQNVEKDPQALLDAATDLQQAALDFQQKADEISQQAADAGIPLE